MNASERFTQALSSLADRNELTPCQQGRQGHRWTSEDYDELQWAAFHCVSMRCPLLELCDQAADDMKVKHFTWGGHVRTKAPRAHRESA